jgi:hypothetical protein
MREFLTVFLISICFSLYPGHSDSSSLFDATIKLEIGEDLGQGLGSLFEVLDKEGKVILGAGFNDIHSTYLRDNNRILDFYYRGKDVKRIFERLLKPFSHEYNGSRLLLDGDNLLTYFREGNPVSLTSIRSDGTAQPYTGISKEDQDAFYGLQYVNNRRMVFHSYHVTYDGQEIFRSDHACLFYYVKGRLFVFQNGAPSLLLVYRWNPSVDPRLTGDPERFEASGDLFIYGTCGNEVLLVTNNGSIYSYKDGQLAHIRETDGKSWQGYSLTAWYDHHLIGHYPTGSLMDYADGKVEPFDPVLPVPPGVSSAAREAQTLTIYGGDLYAGVWPWGELWRLDSDTKEWEFIRRVFEIPVTDMETAPYQELMKGKPDAINYWGQRIMNLAGTTEGLYISTMNKQGKPFLPEIHDFLTPEIVQQYGSIHRMSGVSQVSRQFVWKPVTEFRFVYDAEGIRMYQDGELLKSKDIPAELGFEGRAAHSLRIGNGVYGPFGGKILSTTAHTMGNRIE